MLNLDNKAIKDIFYTFSLENNFILFNKSNNFIILNQKGKYIWDKLCTGNTKDGIKRKYKEVFHLLDEEVEYDINAFFDLISYYAKKTKEVEEIKKIKKIPAYTPSLTRKYKIYNKTLSLHLSDQKLGDLIIPLLSSWEKNFDGPCKIELDFLKDKDDYVFYVNKKEIIRNRDLYYVRGVALYEIVKTLVPEKKYISVFHGAVLQNKGHVIVLSGKSGYGKSTLGTYLISLGFESISDDMVLLDKDKNIIETPFSISLKEKSWDILSPYLSLIEALPIHNIYKGKIKYYTPPKKSKKKAPYTGKPNILIFSQYIENYPETEINPISKTDAFIELINAGAWVSPIYENLKIFIDWIKKIPTYKLLYSNLKGIDNALMRL